MAAPMAQPMPTGDKCMPALFPPSGKINASPTTASPSQTKSIARRE